MTAGDWAAMAGARRVPGLIGPAAFWSSGILVAVDSDRQACAVRLDVDGTLRGVEALRCPSPVTTLAAAATAGLLLTEHADGSLTVWRWLTHTGPASPRPEVTVDGTGSQMEGVRALAVDPAGSLAVVVGDGGAVQVVPLPRPGSGALPGTQVARLPPWPPRPPAVLRLPTVSSGNWSTLAALDVSLAPGGHMLAAVLTYTYQRGPQGRRTVHRTSATALWDVTEARRPRQTALLVEAGGEPWSRGLRMPWHPAWPHPSQGHPGEVECLTFTPDGRLVTGGRDHTLTVWDISDAECPQPGARVSLDHRPTAVCVSPDTTPDSTLLAASGRHAVSVVALT